MAPQIQLFIVLVTCVVWSLVWAIYTDHYNIRPTSIKRGIVHILLGGPPVIIVGVFAVFVTLITKGLLSVFNEARFKQLAQWLNSKE